MVTYDAGSILTATPAWLDCSGGIRNAIHVHTREYRYHTREYMFSHVNEYMYHTPAYIFSRVNIRTTHIMVTDDAGGILTVPPGGALGSTAVVVTHAMLTYDSSDVDL